MQITRQSEYAIRTMLELAKAEPGELISTRVISERQDIPEDFLKKTVKLLALADLVITQRGNSGGIRLAKAADQITLADIISAVEGPIALNVCLLPGYQCPNKPECPISRELERAQKAMLKELNRHTLADLIK
ncbi:Rrf2 family transcriptional regulator [Thermosyntropha sp.]|uniref:RrF2 family transcriptional regulator n=1 Tax=Thermosyntropha sp. TaxID=2740820 RepID=UPI0025D96100|nr:Rrf2 family transcriptional regulator [Thermosyntropha sp.]MBO8158168.1 Rrf2 family transcriptional regulator [Thermosyntropha sp.]